MKQVYVLTWDYDSFEEIEGVTTDEAIAKRWEKYFGQSSTKVDLIENDEQYEEFLNT